MNKMLMHIKNNIFIYIFALVVIFLYLIIFPRFVHSDDAVYSDIAYKLTKGIYEFNVDNFCPRFGVFLPTAFFYLFLGANIFTLTLWPLLAHLITILFLYYFIKKHVNKEIAILSSLILSLNMFHMNWALELSPDIILVLFSTIPLFIIYATRNKNGTIFHSLIFVIMLFFGFITKENIIVLLPFLFIIFVLDIYKKSNFKFWIFSVLLGIAILALYFLFYKYFTGSCFYRFENIESGHNMEDRSYIGKPDLIIKRLTYLPILMFVDNFYLFLFLSISLPFIIYSIKNYKEELFNIKVFSSYTTLLTIVLFLSYWFMSTSLKGYNPFSHYQDRNWILLSIPLIITSVYSLNRYLFNNHNRKKRNLFLIYLFIMIIIAICLTLYIGKYKKMVIWGLMLAFIPYDFLSTNIKHNRLFIIPSKKLLICIFILISISYIIPIKSISKYQDINRIFGNYLKNKNGNYIVYTDGKLSDYYNFYYGYHVPGNYKFLNWNAIDVNDNKKYDAIYIIVNKERVKYMKTRYNVYIPKFVNHSPESFKMLYEHKGVILYQVDSLLDINLNY